MAASRPKIRTDEYCERLFVDGQEVFAEDGEIFDVLGSSLKNSRLSDIPVGVKLALCNRVLGSNELTRRDPYCVFENSAEGRLLGHGETPFLPEADDIGREYLRSYFVDAISAGRRAIAQLECDGRVSDVRESIYDDIAYLSYVVHLSDQSFEDAEAYMQAMDSRIRDGLERPTLFICHASEDKTFVERIVGELDRRALYAWFDKREIVVGDSIVEKVNEGLSNARFVVFVMSPVSVTKRWVTKEVGASLMRQLANKNVTILPILIEHCDIPAILTDIKYADFTCSFDSGMSELIHAIRQHTDRR